MRNTGPTAAVRALVRARARNMCEHCGGNGQDIHHRRPRGMGGTKDPAANLPSNLVLLCRQCHVWFESHRSAALAAGWLVRQGHDPRLVALVWPNRLKRYLTDAGSYSAGTVGTE